jgi:hypothetical protein
MARLFHSCSVPDFSPWLDIFYVIIILPRSQIQGAWYISRGASHEVVGQSSGISLQPIRRPDSRAVKELHRPKETPTSRNRVASTRLKHPGVGQNQVYLNYGGVFQGAAMDILKYCLGPPWPNLYALQAATPETADSRVAAHRVVGHDGPYLRKFMDTQWNTGLIFTTLIDRELRNSLSVLSSFFL